MNFRVFIVNKICDKPNFAIENGTKLFFKAIKLMKKWLVNTERGVI